MHRQDRHIIMRETVVIGGSLAQRPGFGGHTWVFLQYLLGFQKLGWDVLFLDRLEPEMCADTGGRPCALEQSRNLSYLLEVMRRFGLSASFALGYAGNSRWIGLPRRVVLERVKHSALFLNVMGFITDPEILAAAPRRVFFDIDPGFSQMWRELAQADVMAGHDSFVTIAENIGQDGCSVPTCGLKWITTRQPVVLDQWIPTPFTSGRSFTTVASWRGPFAPVEYCGKRYTVRAHEFRRFAELPGRARQPFELALDIHSAEAADRALLERNGWSLVDPAHAAADPWLYRRYVQTSKAEFLVAKGMYVETRSGWFSDRSACYLASGKPVLAQDTGLRHLYPTGCGLLTFSSLEEAAAGTEQIVKNYPAQAAAARRIAEACFESDKVLRRLAAKLDVV
jgi:hypothetical protein